VEGMVELSDKGGNMRMEKKLTVRGGGPRRHQGSTAVLLQSGVNCEQALATRYRRPRWLWQCLHAKWAHAALREAIAHFARRPN
jgi:hypothetical protein